MLKVGSWISDCSRFRFSYLKFLVNSSRINRLGATRTEKMQLLGNYVLFLRFLISLIAELIINEYIKIFVPNPIKTTKPDNEVNFCI